MASRKLTVEIVGDSRSLEQSLKRSGESASGFSKTFQKAALPAAAAIGAIGIAAKKSIDDASNLGEQMNKTAVVFGKNGKEVQQWSKGLTKNFGLSQRAALEAAGTYGNMLKPMGLLPKQTKEISMRMVELAGDMASFNNASPEETLDALRAGLAGETEPLRRFGVFLSEATIKAEALSMGLVKAEVDTGKLGLQQQKVKETIKDVSVALKEHGKSSDEYAMAVAKMEYEEGKLAKVLEGKVPTLTAAQKAQASYGVITRSTSDAQGDFARTSDSVANQNRINAAEAENLRAKMGQGLLPAYQALQKTVISLTGFMSEHTTATKILVGVVGGLAIGILAVNVATKAWTAATTAATAAQWLFNTALTANPIGVTIIAIAALGAAVVVAYKKSETFREIVDGLWAKLKSLGSWIREHWGTLSGIIERSSMVTAFRGMANAVDKIIDGIKWLIDHVPKIPKLPGWVPGTGDARDPNMTAPTSGHAPTGVNLMGANPIMAPFAAAAGAYGLSVTSGLRPGAITANGTPSDHGIGKALDVSGSGAAMSAFFRSLLGNRAVKQAFYDPLGSIFGGAWSSYREGGHSDHVHVATYDQGGYLRPGWNLAYNGTGRPEAVGMAGNATFNIQLGGDHVATIVWDQVRQKAAVFEKQNNRSAF